MSLKRVREAIEKNKSFLVSAHVNLEGDAIGSELALAHLLKLKGKSVAVVNDSRVPAEYSFMPAQEYLAGLNEVERQGRRFDAAILVDCSDMGRIGAVKALAERSRTIINIDHHISNARFADINWVVPHASSASELIFKLYKAEKARFDKTSALLLYVGLLTDTGSFRYSNTSPSTHRMAAELLKFGINARDIYSLIYEANPYSDMMALARAFTQLKRDAGGRVIWAKLKRDFFTKRKIKIDVSDQILGFARSVKGVEVAVIFKENLGDRREVRVNFRSAGKVDVAGIAASLGGGGHRTAAGCTVSGNIDNIQKKVLGMIREAIRKI
ncbi:MAG: bifunctional oligoribonuclease/PAP phosphatase NrnA [Candidatus Omnitrophica bacterium]|nr:bifunctional oligoribonuclease/PAP phosphatase NrnA [Candidatus Omnitrophota bacterium]